MISEGFMMVCVDGGGCRDVLVGLTFDLARFGSRFALTNLVKSGWWW